MYAILEESGKQYKVAEGDRVRVEKLDQEPGATITLGKVLLLARGDDVLVGRPTLDNVGVTAQVEKHGRNRKATTRKFRRRKDSTTKRGHRQWFTEVKVTQITVT